VEELGEAEMEQSLCSRKKATTVRSLVEAGYERIYDETWRSQLEAGDEVENYHVEVWIKEEHHFFFFTDMDKNSVKVFSCMGSDKEALSGIADTIDFDSFDKGIIFSELLSEGYNPEIAKDLFVIGEHVDVKKLLAKIRKCNTLKQYLQVLDLQESLILRHFFTLQECFDGIKEKAMQKRLEYRKCVDEVEDALGVTLPDKIKLSEISEIIKEGKLPDANMLSCTDK
jgi:hypothetical protein